MIPRIENRKYHYSGMDVCSVYASLNIYADDGTTILHSTGLVASYNMNQDDFVEEITRQLQSQVQEYLTKLLEVDARRQALFPGSVDFSTALDLIFDPIQVGIGG